MPNMTTSLTASQALRRWRKKKDGGRLWHANNSAPIEMPCADHILERVPETPGTRGQPWTLALCFAGQAVDLKSV